MKKINIISTILASVMIISAQLNAADQLSPTDAESNITALQKELADATNEAAKEIVKAMLIRDEKDQNKPTKIEQEAIITDIKKTLKETYDTIKAQINQEQKNTSYFSQFISGAKKAGKYVPYFVPPMGWLTGGPQYTDQEKDLARAIIIELEKKKTTQPEKKEYFNAEIEKQQIISGNPIGTLKIFAAAMTTLGAVSLLHKYTGFLTNRGVSGSLQSAD